MRVSICCLPIFLGVIVIFFSSCSDYASKSDINGLQTDVTNLELDIDNLELKVSDLSARIDTLKSKGYSQFYVMSGILYSYNRDSLNSSFFWEFSTPIYSDSALIETHIRQNAGYLWIEPLWYLYEKTSEIRIFDNSTNYNGYEYQIVIARKQSYSKSL